MPTPSNANETDPSSVAVREWTARPNSERRSVFGNYQAVIEEASSPLGPALGDPSPARQASTRPSVLQASIDSALGRAFVYRLLAKAYEDPTEAGWVALTGFARGGELSAAVRNGAVGDSGLAECAANFESDLQPGNFEAFLTAYLAAFGHAARGQCPLNEVEYGDIKADPLFQPHRLADLAAFYRAFGLEMAPDAGERHDHISVELEFMSVLAAKEAYALEYQLDQDELSLCQEAQKKFAREHLGRWTPAFARRLARMAEHTPLAALAKLTGVFVVAECQRLGLLPGSEDLLLRPVDEAAERACASCGVTGAD